MEYHNIKFSLIVDAAHIKNNTAIPAGIGIFTYLPNISLPVFVKAEAEYAPKILSFDDADRFSRIDTQIGYFPIDNARIFLGYRSISFSHSYNSCIYAGLGYSF